MAHSMLKVVHVQWTGREEGAPPPWVELEQKLRAEEIMTLEGTFTVVEDGPEGRQVHLIAVGEQAF